MLPVASAVCELHAAGIVHRDLKPSNILLARDRGGAVCPKVADFGVSRMDDGALISTDPEAVLGTYPYMAPEQARSSSCASEASDQYSLGIILYECATGRKPFTGKGPADLVMAIMTAAITPPSELNPALPPRFEEVVLRALCRDRDDRYACVDELRRSAARVRAPACRRAVAGRIPRAIDDADVRARLGVVDGRALALIPSAHGSVTRVGRAVRRRFLARRVLVEWIVVDRRRVARGQ